MTKLRGGSTYSSEGPECPYCGFVFTPDEGHYFDENRYTEDTCPECEKKFKVEVFHRVTWSCEVIDPQTIG